ncbi:MFS transporter [Amycolatopsis sp. H20-H5]|uniref:MFS transporter n=1 Tax=Amycolatopsis sp. H20-H5 TaxID=3046309 RepID=UPI002DBA89DA|nr:MFS transporter [Amycolatopsis sp. H20-H5]MEC3977003.1 MFS transporter [Amycolatopsis sp. H20-H5]
MTDVGKPGFGVALRSGEFRALWSAEILSVFGDQIARVALALLVFARTHSAALTALTYALTFVPAVLGGLLLSGLADRYPRRAVIVVTDVVRAVLAVAIAIPGLPLEVLWVLVGLLTMAAAPFKAAQLSLLPQVLPEGHFQAGLALRQIGTQTAQVAGFGLGGLLVTALGTTGSILINAASFLASAALVLAGVRSRPAARAAAAARDEAPVRTGFDLRLAVIFGFAALIGLFVVPEGLAAPYANAVGVTSLGVGLLMAADPVGSVLGAWWATRTSGRTSTRPRTVVVPAVLAGVPLIACAVVPGIVWPMVLWAASGAFATLYLIRLQAVVVAVVPDARRGTVMGRLSTCLYTSQGVAIVSAGVLAEGVGPVRAVAAAGALASVLALAGGFVWRAAKSPQPDAAEDKHDDSEIPAQRGSRTQAREDAKGPRAAT